MHKIYKYSLPVQEKYRLELPKGYNILRVQDVDGLFFLWAVVDTDTTEFVNCELEFYKTGQPIENPNGLKFLGACKLFIMQELCLYVFERL
jgi:hypothetical protein